MVKVIQNINKQAAICWFLPSSDSPTILRCPGGIDEDDDELAT